ncbi:MAG: hypothetical protein ABSH14_04100 [Verrucomicrobiia bacterium]|jgi:alpha-tubulin suppressor-like RCC1 family protein
MKKRSRLVFSLIFAAWLSIAGTAQAQDTITDATQFTAVFDQPGLSYPSASPFEGTFQPMDTWFLDFTALTNAIGAVTNYTGQTQNGVTVWPLRLIQAADTGEVVLKYAGTDEVELLRLAAPTGYAPFQTYDAMLPSFCTLSCAMNPTNYDGLIADGYTFLDPPRVVIDGWAVSAADEDAYFSYSEPQGTGRFTLMSEDDDPFGDIDPCNITNIFQPFSFTSIQQDTSRNTILAWQACTNFIYGVFSTDELSTNTFWTWRAYLFGQPNSLTWTDTTTSATNVVNRFYRAVRKLPVAIAAGGAHTLALRPDNSLWSWGRNQHGQLGDGTSTDRQLPARVVIAGTLPCAGEPPSNVVTLAAGTDFSMLADASGMVWTWGRNDMGQLGDGSNDTRIVASPITGISNVVSVAAGSSHTLALRADGTVWAWGNNQNGTDGYGNGQLGAGYLGGASSTNSPVQSLVPAGTVIAAIAAGDSFSLALDTTGQIWGWGGNESGELGTNVVSGRDVSTNLPTVVAGISNVVAIAAGSDHTVALTADKTVWTWGDNSSGQLGWGGCCQTSAPGRVSALSNVVGIAGGLYFTLAVTSNGQVFAWGDNTFGQLGTNTDFGSLTSPHLVAGISNAVLVSAHPDGTHSVAMTISNGVYQYWAWGDNANGQVGNGTEGSGNYQYTPASIQFSNSCVECIALGTGGVFTAQCTGTLILYFNDDFFPDNSGAYTVTVYSVGMTNVVVESTYSTGIIVGTVTNGGTYTYAATGLCIRSIPGDSSDANGYGTNGVPVGCDDRDRCGFICPTAPCYSLVGKIQ